MALFRGRFGFRYAFVFLVLMACYKVFSSIEKRPPSESKAIGQFMARNKENLLLDKFNPKRVNKYSFKIPRRLFQTSKEPLPVIYTQLIKANYPKIDYFYFNDEAILKFFKDNPLEDFPDIEQQFLSFTFGEHKADLFRYYYLYIKGGIYLDFDVVLLQNIDEILMNYDFFTVQSKTEQLMFQGILGAAPR